MKQQLLLILALFITLHFQAQVCGALMEPVSIQNRTNEATLIVEGEVINSQSYWDRAHQNIYTIHEVKVYKNAKGTNMSTVFVETDGGQVGDNIQETSSAARLKQGDEGVFFLKNSNHLFNIPQTTYKMVAAAQGYIKYNRINNKASDVFNVYASIENELYSKIEQATNKTLTVIQQKQFISNTNAAFAIPVITSFTPTTASAGTETEIIISGSSFGSALGQVLFPTANNGGATYTAAKDTQIVIWSDQTIVVKVPFTAGTGPIQVLNASGTTTSTGTLTIPYSHSNSSSLTTDFPRTIQSSGGGVTFDYHTDFNISAAKPYFEQAFGLWNCESGINFAFGTTTTTDVTADDGINIVRFDNGNELPSGVLGQVVTRASNICGPTGNALAREMDITWNDDFNFYYGDGTPSITQYDFKTVALHELGHTHQLNHIINSNNIMHYNLGQGVSKFNLSADDVDGAQYTMSVFTEASQCDAMTENFGCTYVPDDNFEAYLEANGMGNGIANDDLVTTSNISGVTALNVISQGISDFTGLEDFLALEVLNAINNTMTTLNVSANVNLKDLKCTASLGLTSINTTTLPALEILNISGTGITAVDVTNNTALKQISVTSTGITALDVSNNLLLEVLSISNTLLTNLDLSNNGNLTALTATNTVLESLNIKNGNNTMVTIFDTTGSTSLTCITVDNADYSTMNWGFIETTITTFSEDCEATTYVPDDNFEQQLIDLGYDSGPLDDHIFTYVAETITALSFFTEGIADFTGIEDMVNLTSFATLGNPITSLNLNANTALTTLVCAGNTLSTLDLSANVLLESLIVNSIPTLTTLNLNTNTALTYVEITSNNLNALDVSNNVLLTGLSVKNNNLTSLNVSQNTLLKTLKIDSNTIATINLSANTALENFTLENTGITTLDLSLNTNLKELVCSNNTITSLDLTTNNQLTKVFAENNQLTTLNIKNGNNTAITNPNFKVEGNPGLNCINVDDATWSTGTWSFIDGTTSFGEHCYETYVPDDNFENYLETHNASGAVVSIGDSTSMGNGVANDDYVLTSRINTVTNLTVLGLSISDLTGINAFEGLTGLNCNSNNLTTLDLSNNTNLQVLAAQFNNINTINLTGLSALSIMNLRDNLLTTVDLSSNTGLTLLILRNNNLSALDLTANSALVFIDVTNNELTSLNVKNGANMLLDSSSDFNTTGNPNLTCINVDDEDFSTATWENIDATASFSEHCGLTYVPDDNFETRLIELGYDSGPLDDFVPTNLISGVTFLNVSGRSIADLTGLEDFTALETIFCNNNNLTTINTSQNTALFNLRCHTNQISSLDLSANTNLQYLSASPNNLTTLDLQFNTALKEAFLTNNDLVELNLDNCVALERLQIKGNNLSALSLANGNNINITEFTAENNPNLSCINVDDATASYLSDPFWIKDTTASYSVHCNDTYVPDDNFEAFLETNGMGNGIANDDYVTTANIATVTNLSVPSLNISDLTGIEDFVALTSLNCGSNQLTSLDVTSNTLLNWLTFYGNLISSIDLSQNTQLQFISAGNNNLTSLDFSNNPLMEEIDCPQNQLATINVSQCTVLNNLTCNDNNLQTIDLTTNTALDYFEANNNDLIELNTSQNPNLEFIAVNNNQLTSLNVSQNINLMTLDVEGNQITNLDLSLNVNLEEIICRSNLLTSLTIKSGNNTNIDLLFINDNPNLTCVLVDDTSYTFPFITKDPQTQLNDVSCGLQIAPKVFLQGAALNPNTGEETLMRDDLRVAGYIPTSSPYNLDSVDVAILNVTGNNAIVDWVYVELRDANDNTFIVANTSALLQRDGDVVSLDGVSPVNINAPSGDYYVSIKHRNHLGIMTATTITLSSVATTMDFTDANNPITYGTDAQTSFGMQNGVLGMWAGDANEDGRLNYLGSISDVPFVRSQVFNDPNNSVFGGPPVATYGAMGYHETDINMDGFTYFSGALSDILFIRDNIFNNPSNSIFGGPPVATYVFTQQIPQIVNN